MKNFKKAASNCESLTGIISGGTYNIGFTNNEGKADETQFDLAPWETDDDLYQLWKTFCEENDLSNKSVTYIERCDDNN